jgi:hypothetical protein
LENILRLEEEVAELQAARAQPAGSQPSGSQAWLQPEGSGGEGEKGEKGDKGKGDGKGKKDKSRSGWIPKIAPLLAAYYDEDWSKLKSLAASMYSGSTILAELVDQQTRHKQSRRR